MNKILLSVLVIIATCFGSISHAGRQWSKISKDKNSFGLALRKYKKGNKTVKLAAMLHFGEPKLYERINKTLKNKVVIYELAGGTFEQQKELDQAIKSLGDEYALRYQLLRLIASPSELLARKFGLASQHNAVDYSPAARLIHADVTGMPMLAMIEDQDQLKQYIDAIAEQAVRPSILKKHTDKNKALKEEVKIALKHGESLKEIMERDLLHTNKDGLGDLKGRNQIIKDKLQEFWNETEGPSEITVIYGADHLSEIDDFLIEKGFILSREGWFKAIDLTRAAVTESL